MERNGGATVSRSAVPDTAPYNILFIVTDQERQFRPGELPSGYSLPAHERLMRQGTTFVNHRINSCACTSSRSVLYTGQHIQQTGMFDNMDFTWMGGMSTEIPTVGDMLREAGYFTAYKGKWHLTKEFKTVNKLAAPTKIFTEEMEAYGFSDYYGIGDVIASRRGGYLHDGIIAAMGVSWLRGRGRELAVAEKPWFLAVNFVNPHDVMYYDTDAPESPVNTKRSIMPIAREPVDPLYARRWDYKPLPNSLQALDAPGRPAAHGDFSRANDAISGALPNENSRWHRRHDYYLNCLADADRNVAAVLAELEASGLASRTIVILTSDHGDLDGAHQLYGKGTAVYREQNNVPLIIVHPDYAGGRQCRAITSHIDLAPTLVAMTGVAPDKREAIVRGLPGEDLLPLLADPESAEINALHDGVLFNFNMFTFIDGDFLEKAAILMQKGRKLKEVTASGVLPNLNKRGAVRSIFDGRFVFARYFSPRQHNRPTTLEDIHLFNDVELFDLEVDPLEMNNLAMPGAKQGGLVLTMNAKLNQLIDSEVGEDNGQMLPGGVEGGWEVTRMVS